MTSREIVDLLRIRHSDDLFISECKDGPTHTNNHVRMDGWAMRRSWSNPLVTGYEVKVSRSDFSRDTKWPAYLPLCNSLYFVCPAGLIDKTEVPEQCGLLIATAKRLLTKKPAPYREVTIPESLFRYVLICRATVQNDEQLFGERGQWSTERWRQWLAEKDDKKRVGSMVKYSIRNMIEEAENKLEEARKLNEANEAASKALSLLGISRWDQVAGRVEEAMKRKSEELNSALPPEFMKRLNQLVNDAQRVLAYAKPESLR